MKPLQFVGLAILLVTTGILAAFQQTTGLGAPRPDPVVVRGLIGSEKANLLQDPTVRRILDERYGITVDYRTTGSIKLVSGDAAGQDFLWPGSQYAREVFESTHPQETKSEVVFYSPVVVYARAPVTQALLSAGLVERAGDASYLDLDKLVQAMNDDKTWRDIGLAQLNGPIVLHSTDPTKSNSGNTYAGLLANTLNGGVADEAGAARVLPQLKALFARQGYMEESSAYLFDRFLALGIGTYPMMVGYENQLIEYSLEHPEYRDLLQREVNILYLRPSAWASHTVISLDARGARFIEALKDPQLQKIAWEQHGFRSGLLGAQNDPSVLQVAGIPQTTTESSPLPRVAAMDRIVDALRA